MARRALGGAALAVVAAVRAALADAEPGAGVRVACSGGADSLALAVAAGWVVEHERPDLSLHALVVDHGLQADSASVADGVVGVLAERGITVLVARVEVDEASGLGPEAAAREARYAALGAGRPAAEPSQADQPVALVLLGHTLDDQAETVLLGLARGSGTRSLAGMPAAFGSIPRFVRPLLGLRRSQTRQACEQWGVQPWDDPHNADPRFLRSRVRAEVLPVLVEVLGAGTPEALARTAHLARADADLLDALAAEALASLDAEPAAGLPCGWLAAQPDALRGRILRAWLASHGVREVDFERTTAVLALVDDWHGQADIDLPGGVRVRRVDASLELTRGRSRHL